MPINTVLLQAPLKMVSALDLSNPRKGKRTMNSAGDPKIQFEAYREESLLCLIGCLGFLHPF